ncbi:GNAT family N-acetyltransferase [Ideonella livida]|uniref:GNAT family N-acetyltransferase n=1 Tax=Ideonella livida TaxID=2707176 RepID=A0A7C9TK78_9BURK|nr:GNAT family N-acetyltransferase [Ideonella livida]NDY91463.1 GNAT family N-acetyltransferase [Ideonella livida]
MPNLPEEFLSQVYEQAPRELARLVDTGLEMSNEMAAPLDQVRPLAVMRGVADAQGRLRRDALVGGAMGRSWGACVELQQLWVHPDRRLQGHGRLLVEAFERAALQRGCRLVYLETFTFQAPEFYARLGYQTGHQIAGFGAGIRKLLLTKALR